MLKHYSDGPLLQRASSVVSAEITNHPMTLKTSMVPEIPKYFSGSWSTAAELGAGNTTTWSGAFNLTYPTPHGRARNDVFPTIKYSFLHAVAKEWIVDAPFHGVIQGCPGTCRAKLRAPALAAVSCATMEHAVNYSAPYPSSSADWEAIPLYEYAYLVSPMLNVQDSNEKIDLITVSTTAKSVPLPPWPLP